MVVNPPAPRLAPTITSNRKLDLTPQQLVFYTDGILKFVSHNLYRGELVCSLPKSRGGGGNKRGVDEGHHVSWMD